MAMRCSGSTGSPRYTLRVVLSTMRNSPAPSAVLSMFMAASRSRTTIATWNSPAGKRALAAPTSAPDLRDRDRVQRSTHRSGEGQRRRDQLKLVDAVGGTVGRERFEVEDLAEQQAHVHDGRDVDRQEHAGDLARHRFCPQRVDRDRPDLLLLK